MEIIEAGASPGNDLVQIAYADTREEAALIRGLLREEGIRSLARQPGVEGGAGTSSLLVRSPRRIYVRPEDAVRSRELLAETMVEDPLADEIPESANEAYLAEAAGHRPRNYGIAGFYLRSFAVGIAFLAIIFAVLLILR